MQLMPRHQLLQCRESRHQPQMGKPVGAADRQGIGGGLGGDPVGGLANMAQAQFDRVIKLLPGIGQLHPVMQAVEQAHVEQVLQRRDMPADRRLRCPQAFGRLGETALVDGNFKRVQMVERHGDAPIDIHVFTSHALGVCDYNKICEAGQG